MALRVFSWFTLGWTLLTILVGAVVRATHSGDGCGASWPSCDGAFTLSGDEHLSRIIEFSHRTVSGLNLVFVVVLLVAVLVMLPRGHRARRSAPWVLVSILIEAGIGAMIVLYGWVAADVSPARQISVPLHLLNTLVLTGVTALCVWHIGGGGALSFADRGRVRALVGLATMLGLVAATGATTSLADTLFPSQSLSGGIAADLDRASAFIVQIRILHPILAILTGAAVAAYAWRHVEEAQRARHAWSAHAVILCVGLQVMVGFIHVAMLTPLATLLVHLALAQVLWVGFALFSFDLLERRVEAPTPMASALARSSAR